MQTLKKILLATDFSDSAANAGQFAKALASDGQTELHIVAVHLIPVDGAVPESRSLLYEEDRKQLDNYDPGSGLKTVKSLEEGLAAAPLIVDYARNHDIDLIAIGTHSRRGLARFFLGSVAAEVVRSASVSVLVAGPGHSPEPQTYQCIAAPVDLSDPSLAALREAAAIAENHDARLMAIHVVDTSMLPLYSGDDPHRMREQAQEALTSFIKTSGVTTPVEPVITNGKTHTQITEQAEVLGADLIVMGATGRGAVEGLLLGSATSRVLRMAPCPVLVHRGETTGF